MKRLELDDNSSSIKDAKQVGVFQPQLSKARKDVIVALGEDFGDSPGAKLDASMHDFRLRAAIENGPGKLDATVDTKNSVEYRQELRKAVYVTDGACGSRSISTRQAPRPPACRSAAASTSSRRATR